MAVDDQLGGPLGVAARHCQAMGRLQLLVNHKQIQFLSYKNVYLKSACVREHLHQRGHGLFNVRFPWFVHALRIVIYNLLTQVSKTLGNLSQLADHDGKFERKYAKIDPPCCFTAGKNSYFNFNLAIVYD